MHRNTSLLSLLFIASVFASVSRAQRALNQETIAAGARDTPGFLREPNEVPPPESGHLMPYVVESLPAPANALNSKSVLEPNFQPVMGVARKPAPVKVKRTPKRTAERAPKRRGAVRGFADFVASILWSECSPCLTGIAQERVAFAPYQIQVSQPANQLAYHSSLVYDFQAPNRAEYLWAASPLGPGLAETSTDYQEFRLVSETAPNSKFSLTTSIPVRAINPDSNSNHAGMGDMSLSTKTVLLDGSKWQVTQVLNTFVNTGSASMGLGTGRTSMEAGVLARFRQNDRSALHGELKYFFPLGGTPGFAGEVFKTGIAWTWVGVDRDDFGLLHSLETTYWSLQNGSAGGPAPAQIVPVDGFDVVNLFYGNRFIFDRARDLGLSEYGFNCGVAISEDRLFRSLFQFEARFSW